MDEATKEVAKATQEVAKAAQDGIRATERLGAFAAGLVQEPAETIIGILTDRLKFTRWRRQVRLLEQAEKILRSRNLQGRLLPVSPKLALPILENATLEEDDALQDLWVRLLVAATDPAVQPRVRIAFVDVIKQLESIDARVLNYCYERAQSKLEDHRKRYKAEYKKDTTLTESDFGVATIEIGDRFSATLPVLKIAIDNLMRQRCIASYLEEDEVDGEDGPQTFTRDRQYDEISVTPFGCSFVEACMWK